MNLREILSEYLRNRPLFLSLIRAKEVELYQRYLPLKKPVLDVGVGDGFFAEIAFAKKFKIKNVTTSTGFHPNDGKKSIIDKKIIDVGIDVKDSRIDEAGKPGIYKRLVIYDGKKLPFSDNTFSTVISNCVLEHIPNLELTLKEIQRVLKPGGLFLTTVVAKPWEEYFLGNLILGDFYKMWMRKKQIHINMYSEKEWKQIFKKYKYKIIDEIGYLDKIAVRLIDLFHYISLPNLITYKLSRNWVIWKGIINYFPLDWLSQLIEKDIPTSISGNIFFALQKR